MRLDATRFKSSIIRDLRKIGKVGNVGKVGKENKVLVVAACARKIFVALFLPSMTRNTGFANC